MSHMTSWNNITRPLGQSSSPLFQGQYPSWFLLIEKKGFGRNRIWTCILISCSEGIWCSTNEQIQTMKVSTLLVANDSCCSKKRFWPWQDLNLHPHGGSRTRNLLLRRLAPYPLGHMVLFQWATRPSDKPKQMQTMEVSLLQHSLQTRRKNNETNPIL